MGSILFTDGARAYRRLAHMHGMFDHRYVNHGAGEFARRDRVGGRVMIVSTNQLEGLWGRTDREDTEVG